ncbi:MAG: hypothetical protein PHW19_06435 [Salinivirgaceae bacterium]|nr:hypothetical protein [Salinivirgaceae bacterium]
MNKTIRKLILPVIVVVLTTMPACIGDNFELDKLSTHVYARSEWNIPVAYGKLSVQDIVDMLDSSTNDLIIADEQNAVVFRLQDTMLSNTAADIFTLHNQDFYMNIGSSDYDAAGGFVGNTVVIQKNDTQYPFGVFTGQLLDSILFFNSDLRIKINSNIEHGGQLIITFPEVKKNGVKYTKAISIEPQDGTFTYNVLFNDIKGHSLDLTNANDPNSLFIQYTLLLNDNGSGTFDASQSMNIDIEMYNNKYDWLHGYVGQFENMLGPSAINLDFLSAVSSGTFHLDDPKIDFIVINSFGLPAQYGFDYAIVHNERLNRDDNLDGVPYFLTNPQYLPIPPNTYPSTISSVSDTVSLFGEESNVSTLLFNLPSYIEYAVKIKLNPDVTNTEPNYMTKDSRIDVISVLDIPFRGRASGIAFTDTLAFDFTQDSSIFDIVENVKLKLEIGNGFPHDIRIQGVITDMYGTPLDSLFLTLDQQFIIESGKIVNGRIDQENGKTFKTTVVEYNKDRFDKWNTATHIIIFAHYNTTLPAQGDQESVIYYMDYGVDVRISGEIVIEIDQHL